MTIWDWVFFGFLLLGVLGGIALVAAVTIGLWAEYREQRRRRGRDE